MTVQFLKNPDILHWGFEAHWLGEDEWGDWIAVPPGTKRWKGDEVVRPSRRSAVFCAPRGEWWHLHYNGGAEQLSHFVDIVTPPVWVGENRYEMVDLDLDVIVDQAGIVAVDDEDEFEVHQVEFSYTDEMISRAESETKRVVQMLNERREPFFNVAETWLQKV